jgi:hypothetical protein
MIDAKASLHNAGRSSPAIFLEPMGSSAASFYGIAAMWRLRCVEELMDQYRSLLLKMRMEGL